MPTVIVVGLGPAGPDLLTTAARSAIDRSVVRFVRTARHPSAAEVAGAESFDHLYDSAEDMDSVYEGIVEALVGAAVRHGEVLYAVPGSPTVAERSVTLLVADPRVDVQVVAGMSFLDLAWARLGVDPLEAGARLVDGQRFAVQAAGEPGPLLVAQCDSPEVLSEVKLALDAGWEPALAEGAKVTVLHHLGLPDESVTEVAWTELDRVVRPDHLTSIWIPEVCLPVAREVERLTELVGTLRRECPWDREQTHTSLTRHLLEETYEVLDAIAELVEVPAEESGEAYAHLEEELGDLLFQIAFHSQLATEAGMFTLADVARGVHDKLRSRHPHVFPSDSGALLEVAGPDDVVRNWEELKKAEKGRESVFDGIPDSLPALLYALKVRRKTEALIASGVAAPEAPSMATALERLASDPGEVAVGEMLLAVVDHARATGVDPEAALRAAAVRARDLARKVETARPEGGDG